MQRLEHDYKSQSGTLTAVLKDIWGIKVKFETERRKIEPMHNNYPVIKERFSDVSIKDVLEGGSQAEIYSNWER